MKEPEGTRAGAPESALTDADPHPLVAREREILQRQRVGDGAEGRGSGPRLLDPGVSANSRDRALRLFDLLLTAAEARGHQVMPSADSQDGACVVIDGQSVRVRLMERYERYPHVLTKDERQLLRRWPDAHVPRFDRLPSGELTFIVENVPGARTRWSEGGRRQQEERIGVVLGGIEVAACHLRDARLERERRERERERERLRAEEAKQQWAEEQRRAAELERQVRAWRLARDIRAFVVELRRELAASPGIDGPDDELATWFDWALAHADRIDLIVARRRPRPDDGE